MLVKLLASLSILIPLFGGIFTFKSHDNKQSYFFYYIIVSVLVESLSVITALNSIENIWVFKFFLLFENIFYTWYIFRFHSKKKFLTNLNLFFSFLCLVLIIIPFVIDVNEYYDSLIFIVLFSGFILQALIVLLGLFENYLYNPLDQSFFWIFSGRILYFLITLYVFIFPMLENQSDTKNSFNLTFLILNISGNIICNVTYFKSFLCKQNLN